MDLGTSINIRLRDEDRQRMERIKERLDSRTRQSIDEWNITRIVRYALMQLDRQLLNT